MDRYDYIKLMQIKKMPRTSGRRNIFKGHITGKSKIVEIRLKYVSFLTTQNRHVRQTIGNVMRAQRCRIEEISLA